MVAFSGKAPWIPVTVIAGLALAGAYAVISEATSAALLDNHPLAAVAWRPDSGEAAIAAADKSVSEALTGSEINQAVATAKHAVRTAPASAASVRALAEAYQLTGDEARAQRLMEIAGQRSLRDTPSQMWLLRSSLTAGRFDDAFTRADLLLRRHPDMESYVFPAMVSQLGAVEARTALLARLRRGPPWRRGLINSLSQTGEDGGLAPWVLENLASSPNPPTVEEVAAVTKALVAKQRWAEARAMVVRFDHSKDALMLNDDFERPTRQPPFGWRLFSADAAVSSVESLDSGGHALFAQFPVGRSAPLAEMLLMLEPGQYRLSGRFKIDRLPAGGLFRWRLSCPSDDTAMMTIDVTGGTGWRPLQGDFVVPAQGCMAQWLRLSGTGGEGYQPASAWFDDLRVQRVS